MTQNTGILIVEDESRLAGLLADYLTANGFTPRVLESGEGAVALIRESAPVLVVLDLMLPHTDGITICREVRAFSQVPIIMTTARVEEIDRLLGLELGADDYVCKPYSPREVVARIKAVLRRTQANLTIGQPASADGSAAQELELDPSRLRAQYAGRHVTLTSVEFALLEALHARSGQIFSRDALMNRIYNDHRVVSDRTIDSHVKKIRRKLDELRPNVECVHSVYGAGYRYEEPLDEGTSK